MEEDLKLIEGEIVPIYENEKGERLINARELNIGRDFTTWIKNRINIYQFKENQDYILTLTKMGERKNVIKHEYYLTMDMAKELCMIENNLPHSNFIGAIARTLGMKISYKHYYEDDEIAIVPDISKGNQYYQIYYKPTAVNRITKWFEQNREETEYKIIYERNTKNGKRGEIKERGYKVENVCYKIRNS